MKTGSWLGGFHLQVGHGRDLLPALRRAKNSGLKLSLHLSEVWTHLTGNIGLRCVEETTKTAAGALPAGGDGPAAQPSARQDRSRHLLAPRSRWIKKSRWQSSEEQDTTRWKPRSNDFSVQFSGWRLKRCFSWRAVPDVKRQRANRALLRQASLQVLVPVGTSVCNLCKLLLFLSGKYECF